MTTNTPIELIDSATETSKGLVERATQAEVDAATDTERYVTPATLSAAASVGGSDMELLGVVTAASSYLEFESLMTADYSSYLLILEELRPSSDGAQCWLRTSTNNGVSYDAGSFDYGYRQENYFLGTTATGTSSSTDGTYYPIAINNGGLGSDADEGGSGRVEIINASGTAMHKPIKSYMYAHRNTNYFGNWNKGVRKSTADVDALQVRPSSGTFTSGRGRLYGRKASI